MKRNLILLLFAAALVAIAAHYLREPGLLGSREPSNAIPTPLQAPAERGDLTAGDSLEVPIPEGEDVVFDISVHTEEEMRALLERVEQLAMGPQPAAHSADIALVLHGPEVAFFARQNYERYKDIVDLAAKLSAFEAITIKMCQTRMRSLGIRSEDIPAFIEQVPFGPGEVDRLARDGYVVM